MAFAETSTLLEQYIQDPASVTPAELRTYTLTGEGDTEARQVIGGQMLRVMADHIHNGEVDSASFHADIHRWVVIGDAALLHARRAFSPSNVGNEFITESLRRLRKEVFSSAFLSPLRFRDGLVDDTTRKFVSRLAAVYVAVHKNKFPRTLLDEIDHRVGHKYEYDAGFFMRLALHRDTPQPWIWETLMDEISGQGVVDFDGLKDTFPEVVATLAERMSHIFNVRYIPGLYVPVDEALYFRFATLLPGQRELAGQALIDKYKIGDVRKFVFDYVRDTVTGVHARQSDYGRADTRTHNERLYALSRILPELRYIGVPLDESLAFIMGGADITDEQRTAFSSFLTEDAHAQAFSRLRRRFGIMTGTAI